MTTLRDHFREKFQDAVSPENKPGGHGQGAVSSQSKDRALAVSSRNKDRATASSKSKDRATTNSESASQDRKKIIDDEWTLQCIDTKWLPSIIEAFDDNSSGYITIAKINHFTKSLPKELDWR